MAISVAAGQAVAQPDWEALAAQHGGTKSTTKLGPSEAQIKEAGLAGDDDPAFQQRPIYRYYFNDGSHVDARTASNGADYAIIDYKPSPKFQQEQRSATATTGQAAAPGGKPYIDDDEKARENGRRWGWNPATRLYDRDLGPSPTAQEIIRNRSLPPDLDPRAETDAERATRAKETIARQDREAQQYAPSVTRTTINGQVYTTQTTPGRNGAPPKVEHFGPDGKPVAALPTEVKPGQVIKGGGPNKEDVQAVVDPQTGAITYRPITGAQVPAENRPIPADAPKYTPNYDLPDLGLVEYNERLLQWANLGGPDRIAIGRRLLEQAGGFAERVASHGTTLRSQQQTARNQDITQRQQDLSETQSRRSFQGTGFDNLFAGTLGNAQHLGRGKGVLAVQAFMEALGPRQQYAANVGGFRDIPQVGPISPALEAVRQTTQVDVGQDGNVTVSPPGAVPASAQAAAPPAIPMTPERPAGIMANPVFRPQPMVGGASVPQPDATQIDNPLGVPSYLQPVQQAAPRWSPNPVIADLKARGYPDEVIAQALAEHEQEFGRVA